ncbi:MAG: hypothetical protein WB729_23690 [Candidatus Sulfotelmatobacter sp.]
MGRNSICCGVVFAVIGFIFGAYALSWGAVPNLPLALIVVMCPAALLGDLAPGDTAFLWVLTAFNAIIYGVAGILLANLLHLDQAQQRK